MRCSNSLGGGSIVVPDAAVFVTVVIRLLVLGFGSGRQFGLVMSGSGADARTAINII